MSSHDGGLSLLPMLGVAVCYPLRVYTAPVDASATCILVLLQNMPKLVIVFRNVLPVLICIGYPNKARLSLLCGVKDRCYTSSGEWEEQSEGATRKLPALQRDSGVGVCDFRQKVLFSSSSHSFCRRNTIARRSRISTHCRHLIPALDSRFGSNRTASTSSRPY